MFIPARLPTKVFVLTSRAEISVSISKFGICKVLDPTAKIRGFAFNL